MRCYKCDRCGELYTDKEEPKVSLDTHKLGITGKDDTLLYLSFPFDMCAKCKTDFITWFNEPKFDAEFNRVLQEAKGEPVDPNKKVSMLRITVPNGLDRFVCPVCGAEYSETQTACTKCNTAFDTPIVTVRKANDQF